VRFRRLLGAAARDAVRHSGHLLVASAGVVIGVAAFVFFVGLGTGARQVLLDRVAPERFLEMEAGGLEVGLGPLKLGVGGARIDDGLVEKVSSLQGVRAVFPRLRLAVPAMASGGEGLLGAGFVTELPVDGVEPAGVVAAGAPAIEFADPGDGADGVECSTDGECGDRGYCGSGLRDRRLRCRPDVPVVVSPLLLDLYNRGVRHAHGLPRLDPGVIRGLHFDLYLGASALGDGRAGVRRRAVVAGVSTLAAPMGVTLPIGVVERANQALSAGTGGGYDGLVVELGDAGRLDWVTRDLEALGLEPVDDGLRRAARVVSLLTLVLGLVAAGMMAVAGLHLMHVFLMLVGERRREIGVLRAVGASGGDIVAMMMLEAVAVAAAAGVVGAGLGAAGLAVAAGAAEQAVPGLGATGPGGLTATVLPVAGAAVVLAVLACGAGALVPARSAARPSPSALLRGK
jgi:hypothetical protein